MDINVSVSENVDATRNEIFEKSCVASSAPANTTLVGQTDNHTNDSSQQKQTNSSNRAFATSFAQQIPTIPLSTFIAADHKYNLQANGMDRHYMSDKPSNDEEDDDDDDDDMDNMGSAGDYTNGNSLGNLDTSSLLANMGHSFDDIQFFPSSHHRSLRLQPQFQFHQDQFNDPNFHFGSNLSCFDASNLVSLSASGSVNNSYSLISDSTNGDINSAFPESPFVFPDNVMEYGEPQFFPGNCVGYLETILEEDDEEYEEEEGCSGRHWWTADSDTDTDSVIRVDNNGQTQNTSNCQTAQGTNSTGTNPGEKDEGKPHFRSSASSKPFELEDLHLFDQLDHAFEETLREPRQRAGFAYGHQSQSVEQSVELNKGKHLLPNIAAPLSANVHSAGQTPNGEECQKTGGSNDNGATSHVFIESTNNDEQDEMTTKGLKLLTQENVKAHSEENPKIIYEVGEENEQNSKKLGNAESRETFGSSLSPSSSDSEAPAEVAEEDFFYSSPGSEEEECQEGTESEESCSSDDSEKKGVVLAEFSLGSAGNGNAGFNSSSGMMFGNSRSRRSFESPSRLKSFRSFDSLNCLAGTELLFSKPDTFPSIHHIKEVSEPGSESESSNEVSAADDTGIIPEEDEEEEENAIVQGTRSLPSQHTNGSPGFPGPSLNQISNKNSASSSTSTVSSSASGSGLRSTENLSEDSGIGNDGISSTAASTPGAFIEDSNMIVLNNGKNASSSNSSAYATATKTLPEIVTEADTAGLNEDSSSAKDYITRAEFALNPFVYSSLSSSEPESSINSAPSLSSNNASGPHCPNSHGQNLSNSTCASILPTKTNAKSLLANGNPIPNGQENNDQPNHALSNNKTKEFTSDSYNIASKGEPNHDVQLSLNESKAVENTDLSGSNANFSIESEKKSGDAACNGDTCPIQPTLTKITSISTTPVVGKHADDVSGTVSSSESGNAVHDPHLSMTNDTISLESGGPHPQLHLPALTTSCTPVENYEQPTLSDQSALDGCQDKRELSNNSCNLVTSEQPTNSSFVTSTCPSPPATTLNAVVLNANRPCVSTTDELANTSAATLSTQLPATTINTDGNIVESCVTNKGNTVLATNVSENSPESVTDQTQTTMSTMMDENSMRNENKFENEETHEDIISAVTASFMASLQPKPNQKQHSLNLCNGEKGVSWISSPTSCETFSTNFENEEFESSLNSMSMANASCRPLDMCTKVDTEEERKHAPLDLSSSPLSSVVDNCFSTCPLEQDSQDYSSSSSSDEQHESQPHQSRFHRQRSDSESEYEAAESAVERNNVDMAYDIIVNSPSKKTSSSSPSSTSSGVVGAMTVASTSVSTTSSSPPSSSAFHSLFLSLAHEQLNKTTSNGDTAAAPCAEYHSEANKCNRKSGPVSTLSSLISIHHNDTHSSSEQGDNMRNDKRLPVFESSIDDYDDDDIDNTFVVSTLPISKKHATSNTTDNVIATTNATSWDPKSAINTTRHEDGHEHVGGIATNGKQLQTEQASSSPLHQQPHNHVIENTSLLLHHPQHQQNGQHNQEYENSDELTQVPLPQLHSVASNPSPSSGVGVVSEHRACIVEELKKNKFSPYADSQQKHQHNSHHSHQDQHNVVRSVTLDDSSSADVAHNNVQLNQTQDQTVSTSHPASGIALKSNSTLATASNGTQFTIPSSSIGLHCGDTEQSGLKPTHHQSRDHHQSLVGKESKGYHHLPDSNNKLVTAEPYCPNQIGVAEVKKFSHVVDRQECASFSGPLEPPSASCASVKEFHENNKQANSESRLWNSQSIKSPISETAHVAGATTETRESAEELCSTNASHSPTAPQVNTTGKERVILGNSNFGFFGCSSHSRSNSTGGGSTSGITRAVHESHDPVVAQYSSGSAVLPQVNLDLHSISASESGFSPGYGFPCSLPTGKDLHSQDTLQDQQLLKENNILVPSSVDACSKSISNKSNHSIKRSVSPSSPPSAPTKAAQKSSKEPAKLAVVKRDQEQSKDHKQQQQYQQHLHLEDISLYAGIDKFSVPLGAIKAAVVAVAPSIPTYIVGCKDQHASRINAHLTAEKISKIHNNSNTSAQGRNGATPLTSSSIVEANVNLSKVFPEGTVTSCNRSSASSTTLATRGEENDSQDKATQPSSSSVPDILILKQSCMPSDSEGVEDKKQGVMELDTNAPPSTNRSMSVTGKNIEKQNMHGTSAGANIDSSAMSSIDMLRSDSPTGSSALSGIPLKTKTYGPRNEVEVVVVSSRTPSPAPGGFASTLSSSRKLPSSLSSTSAGQERNEPPLVSSNSTHYIHGQSAGYEHELRESSIPPPPSSPPTGISASSSVAASSKASRSRVHFSPVVSEISWRESYIDQSSECSGSTEDLLANLENLDADGNVVYNSGGGRNGKMSGLLDNGNSANVSLRKAGAAAAAAVVSANAAVGHSGDIKYGSGDVSDVGSSAVRPLQVYDIQMSTRAESPGSVHSRGSTPTGGKGPILVEKVEMTSSPLHDREEDEVDRRFGESHSSRKLFDDFDNDSERVTDLVDFRNNSGTNKESGNDTFSDQNNGNLGLYEDVEVQIEPTTKTHGSTTLSMMPDLLSQCENTNHTLTHIDVQIEENIPSSVTNIVLNIGPPSRDVQQPKNDQHQQPQKTTSKSQSPQPQELSSEPRQILPKMFAEDNKNDNKRNSSSSSLSSTSKGKKSSKGFIIQGLGSAGKKSDKDMNNGKDMVINGGSNNSGPATTTSNGDGKEKDMSVQAKENKKSSKPGFFERLSKIRLSSGSKNKKQKVHPKADEIHQDVDASGTPAVSSTVPNGGGTATSSRPLRSANSVNVNGTGSSNKTNNSGANSSSLITNHSAASQPLVKNSAASGSTIPAVGAQHNGNEMNAISHSENDEDATQAFENILEEIAGLKSIQLRQEKSSNSSIDRSPSAQQVRSFAKRKQFYTNASSPSPPISPNNRSCSDLDSKLTQFKEDTSRTLDAISKSHPDLEIIEDAVKQRQKSLSPEPFKHDRESIRPLASTLPKVSSSTTPSHLASETAQNSEREWYRLLKSAAEKYSYHKGPKDEHYTRENSSHKTGIVETDLDTGASREMLDEDMLQLDCKVPCYTMSTSEIPTSASAACTSTSIVTSAGSPGTAAKTRSLTNLSTRLTLSIAPSQFEESTGDLSDSEERAKSLEFLLDENNKSSSVPPENKLRLETRQLSEHELRIQRSLQRLNVPEWYKQHGTVSSGTTSSAGATPQSKSGTILKRAEYGSSGRLAGGWTGLSTYKAPSMSSLQSNGGRNSGTLNKNFVRGRPATMSAHRTSKESLLTAGSTSHSPSAFERSSFTYGMPFTMTRFGHGRLSTHSGSVSPPSTPDSTTKTSTYVKKPYLGWRSQERLNAANTTPGATNPTGAPKLSIYLPPAERLAADLMASRAKSSHPPVTCRPPVSERPPLPKAPPRSEKTTLTKGQLVIDEPIDTPGAHTSSPVINKQTSSLAVVTRLPQQNVSPPPSEFSHGCNETPQSHSKTQSAKVSSDVHDSIRQVTTAISHYVNRGQDGQPQQKVKSKTSKKQAIWIESSFVGQKPPSK